MRIDFQKILFANMARAMAILFDTEKLVQGKLERGPII